MWYSGRWYAVAGLSSGGVALDYWLSEDSTVNNPWYVAANRTQATNPMVGFFYDANNGWGGTGRTITFGGSADASLPLGDTTFISDLPLLYHHDFVRYIVDNSDFRSRYTFSSDTWVNASASYDVNSGTITYTVPSGNTSYNLAIYQSVDNSSWTRVFYASSQSGSGTYTIPSSGYYRLDFTYTLNGEVEMQQISLGNLELQGVSEISFSRYDVTNTPNGQYSIRVWFNSPQPDTVTLQRLDGSTWVSIRALGYGDTGYGDIAWWTQTDLPDGYYRIYATLEGSTDFTYDLGNLTVDLDTTIFGSFAGYMSAFFDNFGNVFDWLPSEVRVFIITFLLMFVTLGIVRLVMP